MGKLILYSNTLKSTFPVTDRLVSALKETGLLGQPMDSQDNDFLPGESFLQLISFVGCSTNVCLAPKNTADTSFCHLGIKGPFEQPQLVWDENSRPPRCPECNKVISNWQEQSSDNTFRCNQCGTSSSPADIVWGRNAGYGNLFIEIHNIFPGEARPVPELLAQLALLSETEWSYFFTTD